MAKETSTKIKPNELQANDVVSFSPSASLTFNTVTEQRNLLINCLQNTNSDALYFDLSQVEHCDSAGLALIIEAKRLCKKYQKKISIGGMSDAVTDLVEFCGVKTILS